MTSTIIDVSHHQGIIDWTKVRQAGIRGAYIKATEGNSFVDSHYQNNAAGARNAGLVIGAYHFARPNGVAVEADARREAIHFVNTIGKPQAGQLYLPPCLDLESTDGVNKLALRKWVFYFFEELRKAGWTQTVIYSYVPFIKQHGLVDVTWVARYSSTPPAVPYKLWQNSQTGKIAGIQGNVDTDVLAPGIKFEDLLWQKTVPTPSTVITNTSSEILKKILVRDSATGAIYLATHVQGIGEVALLRAGGVKQYEVTLKTPV